MITLAGGKVGKVPFNRAVFGRAVREVFAKGGFTPEMLADPAVRPLIEETYNALNGAIDTAIKTETPPELTAALQNNTFIFSGFKTYHLLSEVGLALTDADGKVKPFDVFRRDVEAIDKRYNTNYLYAEYNHALHTSQMAVRWHDFMADGDRYNLQYRTAGDERVRSEHAALDNTTLPPSDEFWKLYLPPNGWNCRCTVEQVLRDDYPMSDPEVVKAAGDACTDEPKARMFRYNAGQEMTIFPKKHPYLPKGCGSCSGSLNLAYDPDSERCRACKIIQKCAERVSQQYKEVVIETANGGKLEKYHNINTETDDYKRIESVGKCFAEMGHSVIITPAFSSPQNCPSYDSIYGSLKGTSFYGKCPDFCVDGVWYEHEGFTSNNPANALKNMLSHGLAQSSRIVIEDCGFSDQAMLRRVFSRIRQGQNIEEVWVHTSSGIKMIYPQNNNRE